MSKKKYYIVSEDALPDIFIKVAEAKRMLQVGEAQTVGEAARLQILERLHSVLVFIKCAAEG